MRRTKRREYGSLRLRPCEPADYDVVLGWLYDAADLHLFTGSLMTWPVTADDLRDVAAAPGRSSFSLGATDEPDDVLGHVEVSVAGHEAHLSRVALAPSCRGRGWARHLVALAIDEARARGVSSVGLNVVVGNAPAVRTYEGLGFVVVDRSRPGVLGMRLALG